MKKVSIASIPTLLDPGLYSKDDSESTVVKGQTAKLHSRNGGLQDEKQGTRQRKESLMPPIPSPRSSPFFRKASTPGRQDGQRPNTPVDQESDQSNSDNGIMVVGETGYLALNLRKKSSAEKLSDTGFQLYTIEDSNKLPKILKPKKKVSKGSKRKKIIATNDQNNNLLDGSQEDEMEPRLKAIEVEKPGTSEDERELHNKYGLDLKKDFNIEVTRPYTFSYFPEIVKKKKNVWNSEAEKKKSRKISKVEIKTSLS